MRNEWDGKILHQKWVEHSGSALAEMVDWLRQLAGDDPPRLAVGIEIPRGAVVETLVENGFQVFSINPKQLDRFRDRYTPAGAKDDQRDAFVLADALRTDRHCFHAVRLDGAKLLRLRELSRLEEDLGEDLNRTTNQLWQQLHRYFPQLLTLCSGANEPWLWDLLEIAPLPALAAKLSPARLRQILARRRIRRFDAQQLKAILAATPLHLAPGAAEAASERVLILLPKLRLLDQQREEINQRIAALLEELAAADADGDGHRSEHRDVTILLSLPGIGRKVAATMLSEAPQALAERDYHALRCYAGTAPITWQSGKKKVVIMRYACSERLRNALYYWALYTLAWDEKSKRTYAEMRAHGKTHGRALRGIADRWLDVLISMLKHNTLYDPKRRVA
jgi:transposase